MERRRESMEREERERERAWSEDTGYNDRIKQ